MLSKITIKNILFAVWCKLERTKYNFENRSILEINLQGGLCNKIFCLIAACEIANKNNFQILEPEFGWHKKILFSDIYDLDFFNQSMSELCNNSIVMIPRSTVLSKKLKRKIRYNKIEQNDLWAYSEKSLEQLRKNNIIYSDSFIIHILRSLRLKTEYRNIVKKNLNYPLSIQIRIESDWVKHSMVMKATDEEIIIADLRQVINMLKDFKAEQVFFTTGENQSAVQYSLEENRIKSDYFFDDTLEYEINAAINFEILCNSQKFVGLSRSTFSNLITLKRNLILDNVENYIYNYKGKILKRIDYGLYFKGNESVSLTPTISNLDNKSV